MNPASTSQDMISLVYVSSAVGVFTSDQLVELLRGARERNSTDDITGMLLYRSGNFIQVLEGPAAAVVATFQRISSDGRHSGVITILRRDIDERDFSDWSMGFEDLSGLEAEKLDGFTDFLRKMDSNQSLATEGNIALRLLGQFKQSNR